MLIGDLNTETPETVVSNFCEIYNLRNVMNDACF